MSPARRSIKRRDWPRGLYESRPGYFVWRHPDGHALPIGRVPLAVAKNEALTANQHVAEQRPGLIERLTGAANTVEALLEVREAIRGQMDLQLVAFPQDGLLRSPTALALAKRSFNADSDNIRGISMMALNSVKLFFAGKRVKTANQAQNAVPYLYSYAPTGK